MAPLVTSNLWRWDAICVTARFPAHAEAYKRELERRRDMVSPVPSVLILAASDPGQDSNDLPTAERIGSGGATLNALILVAEHLSALADESNIDMNILQQKRTLILHCGGMNQRMPAFSSLPAPSHSGGQTRALSTVDLLLDGLTRLAERCPPGLFVVSSEDSFVHVGDRFCERFAKAARSTDAGGCGIATAVAMELPLGEVATKHGAYQLDLDGQVRRLLYRASEKELGVVASAASRVPKVCGVVYFDETAASHLLQAALDPSFEACSYLGIDNGARPIGFSLYLDLLACLGQDVTEDEFGRSSSLEGQVYVDQLLRAQLWRLLHGRIRLSAVVAESDDPAQYMYVRSTQDFVRLVATLEDGGNVTSESSVDATAHVVNSVLTQCSVAPAAIIESSIIERCSIGVGAVCTGLKRIDGLSVPAGLSLQQVSLGVGRGDTQRGAMCVAVFLLEDEARQDDSGGTFLGQTWDELFCRTGIGPGDLWEQDVGSCPSPARTLKTARLFPVVDDLRAGSLGFLWAEYASALQQQPPASRRARVDLWRRRWLQVWRASTRLTLEELRSRADVGRELEWQDEVSAETNVLRARQLLLHQRDMPLRHVIDDEVRRKRWGLLDVFDSIAAAEDTPLDVAARALAQVAEVLATVGGVEGGLRSGMARNPLWRGALARLACPTAQDRKAAVMEMRDLRSQWINDGPVALIRAARHYEAAAQVLILNAVATCSEFVSISPAAEPRPTGSWITVEAPARIDLAGGWTDTPPVCYAHGGSVLNLAITVDGRRPLGARAQRLTDRFELVFETRSDAPSPSSDSSAKAGDPPPVVCRSLSDLEDYNRPGAPGSLVKCCALSCGIVKLQPGCPPLAEQLRAAGGGLHLVTWSSLPQGSGLGSSSVLAGVAMKATLVAFGLDMDDSSLIHAVQNVEQMLTTGGGWQDQVGAILGGAKITRSAAQLPLQVVPEPLPLSQELADAISKRVVLVFTGRPRLAKNLLQNVIRQWFAQTPEIAHTVRALVDNAEAAAEALRAGDLEKLGACLSEYWAQKRIMAPGSEPHTISRMREALSPGLYGFSLAGAGGGGFAVLLTREPAAHGWVRSVLAECQGMEAAYVCEAAVDFHGLCVS